MPLEYKIKSLFPFVILLLSLPLSATRTYTVLPGHPRLFLHAAPWSGGLTVAELKNRASYPRFAETVSRLHTTSPSGVSTTNILDLCALYFLTDSARYRDSALTQARAMALTSMDNSSETEMMGDVAVLYDWLYAELSLSDKTTLVTHMKTMADAITAYFATARYSAALGTRISSYHLYHSRTYSCLKGLTLIGLALKNDDAAADGYLAQALAVWDSVIVPGGVLSGGALTGGFGYHGYHAYFDILCALLAWKFPAGLTAIWGAATLEFWGVFIIALSS